MKFTFAPDDRPLDGFLIRRAIHRGGFGEVYHAITDGGRDVAIKLLQNDLEVELRGVRQCLNLSHPNLVTIFDVKTDGDGDHWIVMDYVAAPTLAETLKDHSDGVGADAAIDWVRGIADGIGFLHSRGLVHRDIKPANLFGGEGETVQVGDVGLSKFIAPSQRSAQTQSVGTVYYMAPEVARGRYGPEVDQYSLAVVAYELLTGRIPFDGESTGEILLKHLSEQPDLSGLPEATAAVLRRALAKSPEQRFGSVAEFARAFEASLTGQLFADPEVKDRPFEPVAAAAERSWWDSLSQPRQGLLVLCSFVGALLVLGGPYLHRLLPLLAILGGPAAALAWQAEFEWLQRLADPFADRDRTRRTLLTAGGIGGLAIAGGNVRFGGDLVVLGSIALFGLAAIWLAFAVGRFLLELFRSDLFGDADVPPQQPPRRSLHVAAIDDDRSVSSVDRPATARPTPPVRQTVAMPTPPVQPKPKSRPLRRPFGQTLAAMTVIPLLVTPLVVLLGVADHYGLLPPLFAAPLDNGRLQPEFAIQATLFAASAISVCWLLLLGRHATRLPRPALAAGGATLGMLAPMGSAWIGVSEFGAIDARVGPSWGMMLFLPLLLGLWGWSRHTHPLRNHRLSIGRVVMAALVAMPIAAVAGLAVGQAMVWTAVVSSSTQVAAPFVSRDQFNRRQLGRRAA